MPSAKALLVEEKIETARCQAQWSLVPELARKYRKHNPDDNVLEKTILAEHSLIQALQQGNQTVPNYDEDSPETISVPPTVPADILKPASDLLKAALVNASGSLKDQATIVLARIQFFSGDYGGCLNTLAPIPLPPSKLPTGYALILVIQGLALKGMSLEKVGDAKDGLSCYDTASKIIDHVPEKTSEAFMWWAEEALYRLPFLRVRFGSPMQALAAFRNYYALSRNWPFTFRIHKRASFLRTYIRYLTHTYVSGEYVPPPLTSVYNGKPSENLTSPATFKQEIVSLHSVYEQVLYATTKFPHAEETNAKVLEMVDLIIRNFSLIGGGTMIELQGTVEMLYRVTHHTFNSPRVLRHLAHALIALGEFDEAQMALQSYLGLIDHEPPVNSPCIKPIKIKPLDAELSFMGEALNPPVKSETTDMHDDRTKNADTANDDASFSSMKSDSHTDYSEDKEKASDIIDTLLTGAKFFARDVGNAEGCIKFSSFALKLCEENPRVAKGRISRAYMLLGIGYGLLQSKTVNKDARPKYHTTAVDALQRSVLLDSGNWEAAYSLAVLHASMGDIDLALSVAQTVLSLNSTHPQPYHLLAILLSAKGDLDGALRVCDLASQESEGPRAVATLGSMGNLIGLSVNVTDSTNAATSTAAKSVFPPPAASTTIPTTNISEDAPPAQVYVANAAEAEAYYELRVTATALVQALYGPDSALRAQAELIALHPKVFGTDLGLALDVNGSGMHVRRGTMSSMISNRSTGKLGSGASVSNNNGKAFRTTTVTGTIVEDKTGSLTTGLAIDGGGVGAPLKPSPSGLLKPKGYASSIASASSESVRIPSPVKGSMTKSTSVSLMTLTSPASVTSNTDNVLSLLSPERKSHLFGTRHTRRRDRANRALVNLWLFSARAFRAQGKIDEEIAALDEAEHIGVAAADVYCERAITLMSSSNYDQALGCLLGALSVTPHHVPSEITLGQLHHATGKYDLAEGVLNSAVEGLAWASPEAWLALGKVHVRNGSLKRGRECLWYAANLEAARGVRPIDVLPKCL